MRSGSRCVCAHQKVWLVAQVLRLGRGFLKASYGSSFWSFIRQCLFRFRWSLLNLSVIFFQPVGMCRLHSDQYRELFSQGGSSCTLRDYNHGCPASQFLGSLSFLNGCALLFLVLCPSAHDPEIKTLFFQGFWRNKGAKSLMEEPEVKIQMWLNWKYTSLSKLCSFLIWDDVQLSWHLWKYMLPQCFKPFPHVSEGRKEDMQQTKAMKVT